MRMVLRDMLADEIGTYMQRPRLATLLAMRKSPGQAFEAFHNFREGCGSDPIAQHLLKHRASCVVDPRHCMTSLLDGMKGLERHELWYVRFSPSLGGRLPLPPTSYLMPTSRTFPDSQAGNEAYHWPAQNLGPDCLHDLAQLSQAICLSVA
ncbi:TPA: hypothetical protein ACH3X2_012037 [Trebouxia sp. C0005]